MTEKLDTFMDAIELHRQRDALETCLRGVVSAIDGFKDGTEDVQQLRFVMEYVAAKFLLASLDKVRESG